MAKQSTSKSGSSRIRFIMLEADLNDGDLSQVMQAVQNALKPAQQGTRLVQLPASRMGEPEVIEDAEIVEVDDDSSESIVIPRTRPSRAGKPRVAKTPTVLDDIDVASDPSLKDFVAQYDVASNVDKYLVIALWFRDARDINTVTADHVYTCFRVLGWSTATTDFVKPLQNLKAEQSLKGGAKDGFTLTLPGAGKIEAKKRAA